jgi:hypothetical protein
MTQGWRQSKRRCDGALHTLTPYLSCSSGASPDLQDAPGILCRSKNADCVGSPPFALAQMTAAASRTRIRTAVCSVLFHHHRRLLYFNLLATASACLAEKYEDDDDDEILPRWDASSIKTVYIQ